MNNWTCTTFAAVLLIVPGAFASADKGEDLPAAPDGVKYLNRDSYEAMQLKPVGDSVVKNGSFKEGRYWPAFWDPCDKLGTFWAEGGSHGKRCIRMDTTVTEDQWVPWNAKVLKLGAAAAEAGGGDPQSAPADPIPNPPARVPSHDPNQYDTVGGNHGIHYDTEFIKLEPGAIYRLSVDARNTCGGEPMVFVKGFFDKRAKMEEGEAVLKREIYRVEMTLHKCDAEWRRFARVFHPARSKSTVEGKPKQPEWLRVELYAYWPAGVYEFDNVRLDIVGHEKIAAPSQETPAAKQPEPTPAAGKPAPPPLKEDEFPVIGR